jgi:hypothetical protein
MLEATMDKSRYQIVIESEDGTRDVRTFRTIREVHCNIFDTFMDLFTANLHESYNYRFLCRIRDIKVSNLPAVYLVWGKHTVKVEKVGEAEITATTAWKVGDEVTCDDPYVKTYDNGHIVSKLNNGNSLYPTLIIQWHKWGRAHRDQLTDYCFPDKDGIYLYANQPLKLVPPRSWTTKP